MFRHSPTEKNVLISSSKGLRRVLDFEEFYMVVILVIDYGGLTMYA
jgi:hypothetical protein